MESQIKDKSLAQVTTTSLCPRDSPLWGAPFVGHVPGDCRGPGCPDRSFLFLCSPLGLFPSDCH